MVSNRGKKGGTMKSPKMEFHDDDDDFLEDLVVDTNPVEALKLTTYSNMKLGWFHPEGRKIAKEGWKKDRLELQRQKNRAMMMMTMTTTTRKPKKNSWKGKPESYKAR